MNNRREKSARQAPRISPRIGAVASCAVPCLCRSCKNSDIYEIPPIFQVLALALLFGLTARALLCLNCRPPGELLFVNLGGQRSGEASNMEAAAKQPAPYTGVQARRLRESCTENYRLPILAGPRDATAR